MLNLFQHLTKRTDLYFENFKIFVCYQSRIPKQVRNDKILCHAELGFSI